MFKWKNKTLDGFEQEKIKKNILPYSILVAALFAMTFFGVCAPSGGPSGPKGPAAYVDSEVISFKEFRRAYQNQTQNLRNQYGEDYDPAKLRIAETTLNQLVGSRIDYLYALKLGVVASEDEVHKFLAAADAFKDENGKFSPENFKNFLRSYGYTEAGFFEEWARNLTVQKLNRIITQSSFVSTDAVKLDYKMSQTKLGVDFIAVDASKVDVKVTNDEVKKFAEGEANMSKMREYFEKNTQEFNRPDRVKASHILIAFKGARNASGNAAKRSKDAARKLAEKIKKEVKSNNFAALAKKYTDEPSGKKSGGDLGFFTRQMMVKEFSDAAFALNVGGVSGVVESPFGFHIIRVTDKEAAVNKTFDQAKSTISRSMLIKEKSPAVALELSKEIHKLATAKKSTVKILKDNGLKWESTGEFSVTSNYIPKLGNDALVRRAIFDNVKAGAVLPDVVSSAGKHYVIRISKLVKGDLKDFDETKKDQLAMSANFSQGYMFYSTLSNENKQSYTKRDAIKLNDSYLKLDQPVAN